MKTILDVQYNEFCALDMYLPEKENFSTVLCFFGGAQLTSHFNVQKFEEGTDPSLRG